MKVEYEVIELRKYRDGLQATLNIAEGAVPLETRPRMSAIVVVLRTDHPIRIGDKIILEIPKEFI